MGSNTAKAIASVAVSAAGVVAEIISGGTTGIGWVCIGLFIIWTQ